MKHVMLDLETMGTGPQAAIVAIGAVAFDPTTNSIQCSFYQKVDLNSSVELGGVMSADTVLWWMKQDDEARHQFYFTGIPLIDVLKRFEHWLSCLAPWEHRQIWGNGAAFDNVILAGALQRAKIQVPWSYKNDRCYRTLKALYPEVPYEQLGTEHNALDDARSQAIHLMQIFKFMSTTSRGVLERI